MALGLTVPGNRTGRPQRCPFQCTARPSWVSSAQQARGAVQDSAARLPTPAGALATDHLVPFQRSAPARMALPCGLVQPTARQRCGAGQLMANRLDCRCEFGVLAAAHRPPVQRKTSLNVDPELVPCLPTAQQWFPRSHPTADSRLLSPGAGTCSARCCQAPASTEVPATPAT